MKKTRKILLMAACAVLLVCISVGATVAYLTSTDSVTNTFTVGKVAITLDEYKVDEYGQQVGESRNQGNTYKLIPGHTYLKDPTIHLDPQSEDCWLFITVDNPIKDIEERTEVLIYHLLGNFGKYPMVDDDEYTRLATISEQIDGFGWQKLKDNVYFIKAAGARRKYDDYDIFQSFKIKDDADVSTYANQKIEIKAYAVQLDGFNTYGKSDEENALAAWNATFGKTSTTNP